MERERSKKKPRAKQSIKQPRYLLTNKKKERERAKGKSKIKLRSGKIGEN